MLSLAMLRGLVALGFLLLFVLPLYLRIAISSSSLLEQARTSRLLGVTESTIALYRKAASWRAPFTSKPDEALWEMSEYVRQLPEPGLKLTGWRELRSAVFTARSFLNYSAQGQHKDPRIAALVNEAETEIHRLALIEGKAPQNIIFPKAYQENFPLQIAAQFAFWGWILAVCYFIYAAFDRDGKLKGRAALLKFIPVVASYTIWICALLYA